ncbi:prohibitin family protein [Alkalilimnicola sp. S0819]|uniref:prohibitin family protein n=1 Tax=Alkalilimnicola sp. S0819 TaxID=2613922 RepID=UPI001261BA8C|nr:prohibitin family protein [Alkalilimnicola sp. S0819]KAB7627760.1 prohibitin family protein [Alkalilimnicola sp. S0819]MPQ15384.1 prohibitin family protein [Alkalilimnicola sp. S0819]
MEDDDNYESRLAPLIGKKTAAVLIALLVLIAGILLWDRMVVSVKSGESGVLYRFFTGTELGTIYEEGVHVIFPWDRMFIYDVRLQNRQKEYTLLTSGGLPVTMRVAVRYRPDLRMLPLLHVSVGPDYLEKVVFPETEAVLRKAVGQYQPEEVYTSKRGFLEGVVVESLSEMENRYILVDDVLVKSVDLPPVVREAVERKLALKEEDKAYRYRLAIERQEAERKRIEAQGIQAYQGIVGQSLTPDLLRWQGVQATRDLATSPNAKTVVIGAGKDGLPLILGGDR